MSITRRCSSSRSPQAALRSAFATPIPWPSTSHHTFISSVHQQRHEQHGTVHVPSSDGGGLRPRLKDLMDDADISYQTSSTTYRLLHLNPRVLRTIREAPNNYTTVAFVELKRRAIENTERPAGELLLDVDKSLKSVHEDKSLLTYTGDAGSYRALSLLTST